MSDEALIDAMLKKAQAENPYELEEIRTAILRGSDGEPSVAMVLVHCVSPDGLHQERFEYVFPRGGQNGGGSMIARSWWG